MGIEHPPSFATALYVFCCEYERCSLCPFQSVIPPAGSVLGHLQTTVRPVPPRPACTRAAVSPPARKASSSRTTSAKVRAHTHLLISILVSTAIYMMHSLVPSLTLIQPFEEVRTGQNVLEEHTSTDFTACQISTLHSFSNKP